MVVVIEAAAVVAEVVQDMGDKNKVVGEDEVLTMAQVLIMIITLLLYMETSLLKLRYIIQTYLDL